ncbi:MAG: hypothetical protein K1X94_25230 [Sandaracinaceae bacterium]|jgi:hypothetical protein|nr:hypothetical protein [Sandaracinaceae bacterium]
MAKNIVVRWGGEESALPFSKVEREKLYGKKDRIVVDEQGRTCSSAWLTADGSALVLSGGTAHVNVDDKWTAYEQEERRAVDLEGHPLETKPSTLGVAQELVEASVDRMLDCTTSVVYQLEIDTIGPALLAALGAGKILEAPFLYRDGLTPDAVFLLKNDEGVFALVGRPTGFDFVRREALPEPETAEQEDELDADLDFSMM